MEEAGGDIILEVEEEVFLEEDAPIVTRMSLVEDKIRTIVNQVVTSLINKKYNVIIARNLDILHMNVGKKQYEQGKHGQNHLRNINTLTKTMFLARASPIECNVVQEIPCDIWYLDS